MILNEMIIIFKINTFIKKSIFYFNIYFNQYIEKLIQPIKCDIFIDCKTRKKSNIQPLNRITLMIPLFSFFF